MKKLTKESSALNAVARKSIYGVHSSIFHADDVLCVALLHAAGYVENVHDVVRTNNPTEVEIPIDMGGGAYDHHQLPHIEGKPCSFEIILNEYVDTLPEVEKELVLDGIKDFVRMTSNTDNFGQIKYPNTLAWVITQLNSSDDKDAMFYSIAEMLSIALKSFLDKCHQGAEDVVYLKENYSNDEVVFPIKHYEQNLWKYVPKVRMICEPSLRGGHQVIQVNGNTYDFTGCEGLTFQHAGKWLACFDTKDHAVKALMNL